MEILVYGYLLCMGKIDMGTIDNISQLH